MRVNETTNRINAHIDDYLAYAARVQPGVMGESAPDGLQGFAAKIETDSALRAKLVEELTPHYVSNAEVHLDTVSAAVEKLKLAHESGAPTPAPAQPSVEPLKPPQAPTPTIAKPHVEPLRPPQAPSSQPASNLAKEMGHNKRNWLIGLGVAAVALLGTIALFRSNNRKPEEKSPSPEPAVSVREAEQDSQATDTKWAKQIDAERQIASRDIVQKNKKGRG